ncbi:MAG: transcription antitermination factor NusB [Firmicutes bacterium]|nr:transcription antitermination factor NusB [Bacillota bacterium]
MRRRAARKTAFCLLLQHEFHPEEELCDQRGRLVAEFPSFSEDFLELSGHELDENDFNFINGLISGTETHLDEVDEELSKVSRGWKLERMSKVDLSILRLAAYELLFDKNVGERVVINEAVELAKTYSSDEAPAFINGILGKLAVKIKEKTDE